MSRFTGKTALVTGAGSGIGAATCARLLSEGARIIALDREPIDTEVFDASGPAVQTIHHDLSQPLADDALVDLGPIDVLVNAAGVLHRAAVEDHSLQDWEATLAVNVEAPYRLSALFVRQCLRRNASGAIVNVCSIESFSTLPRHVAYTASKTAVLMMTRAFSLELADKHIRVNGIAPGVTETGMNRTLREDPAAAGALRARIPMARFGKPDEQAAAIAFLASDEASYITGAVLPVDGGWLTA